MLMLGIIWGLMCLLSTYQTTLLKNMSVSAFAIGIIGALVQTVTGKFSKKANDYNAKFKNKSLTTIGLGMTIGAIAIGMSTILQIPFYLQLIIIVTIFCIRMGLKGIFQIVKKRYMGNFAGPEILPKIYASYGVVSNIIRAIIEYIGSLILLYMDIYYATLTIGILFTLIVIAISFYMKPRIGTKIPKQEEKEKIEITKN